MPKLRYSWPFYLALIGNIFLWEEIFFSGLLSFVRQWGWVDDGEMYRIIVFNASAFGLYGLALYYIWINRFPKDQKWLISILGLLFPAFITLLTTNTGLLASQTVFTLLGSWCLALGIPFVIRMLNKPERLKTKWTRPKYLLLIFLFAGGAILGIMSLTGNFQFSFYGGKNGDLLVLYLIALQIGLPLSFFLNLMDHHYRFIGKGFRDENMQLIDELGKE